MEFSRKEYWNGLPFPSPGDLLNPGIDPGSPALQADALLYEPPGNPEVKVTQSCLTLCDPMGYTVQGVLQAGIPQWVSLLQWIFRTQGSNRILLNCRRILYQLSFQRSPTGTNKKTKPGRAIRSMRGGAQFKKK